MITFALESDTLSFAGSMASCNPHFSTVFLKLPPIESPKPEPRLPRFPLLYNYRPVTMDKDMMNTVSSMLRFEVDEGLLILKIAMSWNLSIKPHLKPIRLEILLLVSIT